MASITPSPIALNQLQAEMARMGADALQRSPAPAEPLAQGFVHSMADALRRIDAQSQDAAAQTAAVEAGESDDLVGAMLASQQASLSFSMLLQVRNKVAGAFDDLIKLQL